VNPQKTLYLEIIAKNTEIATKLESTYSNLGFKVQTRVDANINSESNASAIIQPHISQTVTTPNTEPVTKCTE
jgi:hypothetical protein